MLVIGKINLLTKIHGWNEVLNKADKAGGISLSKKRYQRSAAKVNSTQDHDDSFDSTPKKSK